VMRGEANVIPFRRLWFELHVINSKLFVRTNKHHMRVFRELEIIFYTISRVNGFNLEVSMARLQRMIAINWQS
jgi:hypothetical protein